MSWYGAGIIHEIPKGFTENSLYTCCGTKDIQPNLVPPVTTVKQCLEYRDRLKAIEPNVDYLMSLYLHETTSPEVIQEAKKAGVTGVKSYPAGVTTVSQPCKAIRTSY
jgi:dihydroorotase